MAAMRAEPPLDLMPIPYFDVDVDVDVDVDTSADVKAVAYTMCAS